MAHKFNIDPDISKAETLPASFYKDESVFETVKEQVFLKSWQWIGDENLVRRPESVNPFVLLDNYLTEPMLLAKDANDAISCLTNVCTHRGNLVVLNSGKSRKLTCLYHGRRFNLKGDFEHMPEFSDAKDFPRPCDSLHKFPLKKWGPFLFAGLNPTFDFQDVIDKMNERIGFLPLNEFSLKSISVILAAASAWGSVLASFRLRSICFPVFSFNSLRALYCASVASFAHL